MILEAAAIAAYQENHASPVIHRLVCDDAKQFYYITTLRALCWVHEERHYEKLVPFLPVHQKLVVDFRPRIWDYYYELTEYKKNPIEKIRLSNLSDKIFSTKTGQEVYVVSTSVERLLQNIYCRRGGITITLTVPPYCSLTSRAISRGIEVLRIKYCRKGPPC